MTTKPDRPHASRQTMRHYEVTLRDGTKIVIAAFHRAMARHYSKSYREEYTSSKAHYRDIRSTRLIEFSESIPF